MLSLRVCAPKLPPVINTIGRVESRPKYSHASSFEIEGSTVERMGFPVISNDVSVKYCCMLG